MTDIVLKVAGISKRFGGLQALSDVGMVLVKPHSLTLLPVYIPQIAELLSWQVNPTNLQQFMKWQ